MCGGMTAAGGRAYLQSQTVLMLRFRAELHTSLSGLSSSLFFRRLQRGPFFQQR
jgi:hypothetical protein